MTVHDHPTPMYPVPAGSGTPPEWTPPQQPESGPQPTSAGKHRGKIAAAGVLVAAVAATAGITAAVVGGDDSSAAANGAGPGGGGQGFGGGGLGRGGATTSLHGTAVVSDGNGGYVTQETQTGTVSAITATSITIKSEDGYSKTYVMSAATTVDNGADQIADIEAGHTVRVVATTADDTATATTLTDTNLATTDQQGGAQQGGPGGGAPMQGGGQPGDTTQQGGTTQGGTVQGATT